MELEEAVEGGAPLSSPHMTTTPVPVRSPIHPNLGRTPRGTTRTRTANPVTTTPTPRVRAQSRRTSTAHSGATPWTCVTAETTRTIAPIQMGPVERACVAPTHSDVPAAAQATPVTSFPTTTGPAATTLADTLGDLPQCPQPQAHPERTDELAAVATQPVAEHEPTVVINESLPRGCDMAGSDRAQLVEVPPVPPLLTFLQQVSVHRIRPCMS